MRLKQARIVYLKKWAAKHECDELKEGVWLQPISALLRRKATEGWTDKHRNVMRKLAVEGGWVQKKLCDTGWSDVKKCGGCKKEETEKHGLCHCPSWREVGNQIPESLGNWEQRAKKVERGLDMARRYHVASARREQLEEKPFVSRKVGV